MNFLCKFFRQVLRHFCILPLTHVFDHSVVSFVFRELSFKIQQELLLVQFQSFENLLQIGLDSLLQCPLELLEYQRVFIVIVSLDLFHSKIIKELLELAGTIEGPSFV